MNVLYKNNKLHFFEGFWRKSKDSKKYDINKKLFPYPYKKKKYKNIKFIKKFIKKLRTIQNFLISNNNFKKYKLFKTCIYTNNKIGNKIFTLFNVHWDDTLLYYIENYNIKISKNFINFILKIERKNKKLYIDKTFKYPNFKIKGTIFKRYNNQYLKLNSNQLRILDSLYIDGSTNNYIYKNKKMYSEHSGLLDFDNKSLDKIIVNGKNNYYDKEDHNILLPKNIKDEADYEFIFHTHPMTKNRRNDKIIYEFPSFSDLLNFAENYNDGYTQGSIIICPEGIYIIYAIDNSKKISLKYSDNNLEYDLLDINLCAYNKYNKKYSKKLFYTKIIKDFTFIKDYNKLIKKYNLVVKYYPRKKKKDIYILPNLNLKLNIIETLKK
tara:strand:+ start:9272 stop:10414 length:1143 start_codon:yes stop_codon:yes gene_type:complete